MNLQAQKFIETWRSRGDEKSDTQQFWTALLHDVYGVEHPENFIRFEQRVKLKNISFMDATIPFTSVLIEQKSSDVDLDKKIRQSDGSELTPLEQAKRYDYNLPKSQRHRWIIACNFREFRIFDAENPTADPIHVLLENLEKDWHVMDFLVDKTQTKAQLEQELSIAAGALVGKLYDALLAQYRDPTSPETLRSLNILCVRLVFCFYAEDADIFGKHNCVCTYLAKRKHDMRRALIDLFHILNQKDEERDPYLEDDLRAFPYVNGGLFEGDVEIPRITPEIAELLTEECSRNFDWSGIDPTIFGAVFESTLNPETRRSGGMHYTSTKNIHRVIDPLFFSDLQNELTDILAIPVEKTRERRLKDFRRRLASLTFFDPACGSGNFLTETYLSIRRLENKILEELMKGQMQMSDVAIQVGIDQFYGIEINDFAVSVARTALWIAESQMLKKTEGIVNRTLNFLPLHTQAHIVEGNALRLDWETVVPGDRLNYIIGNPPFVGHQYRTKEQVYDMDLAFTGFETYGKLDYVAAWYKKAADLIQGTSIRCAFVSTNSICQGESVAIMWEPLFKQRSIQIDFAWRTFRWDSEARLKAHVHCIIVGFSQKQDVPAESEFDKEGNIRLSYDENDSDNQPSEVAPPIRKKRAKFIYDSSGKKTFVENINGYLVNAPDIFIFGRGKILTPGIPPLIKGSQATDGGFLFLTEAEKNELLAKYPSAENLVKPFVGAEEFINNKPRYCLWLKGIAPNEYRNIPPVMERLQKIAELRSQSPTLSVQRDALKPGLFTQIRQPSTDYIIVPRHSSERRSYIPIGYMDKNTICGDANMLVDSPSLFLFGCLISSVHMAWMRVVCGRLKSDYRYTPSVYNNFPWPKIHDEKVSARIEQTAQGILDARALYPTCSLADLYDENTMPAELRNAHEANDKAVLAAYGFPKNITEPEIVAELMKMYQELT